MHGDAHIENVIATTRGVLWTDWEDAFLGPIEFDLACVRSRADLLGEERAAIDAMTAAYGTDANFELVSDLALVRNVQIIPWLAVYASAIRPSSTECAFGCRSSEPSLVRQREIRR